MGITTKRQHKRPNGGFDPDLSHYASAQREKFDADAKFQVTPDISMAIKLFSILTMIHGCKNLQLDTRWLSLGLKVEELYQ